MMSQPIQIDPVGCGCTECLIGLYVPLDQATADQVFYLLLGKLGNATGEKFTITSVSHDYPNDGPIDITVKAEYSGLHWTK